MKLVHVSDTHGYFPTLPIDGEMIIHSGDLCPNKTRGDRQIEIKYQSEWVKKNALTFKDWIGDRPFLFCMGNHDFTPYVCRILREVGIDAIDITSTKYVRDGVRYYGFPFIPYINGEWNGECFPTQMQKEIDHLQEELEKGVDVLVAHAPIANILDCEDINEHWGISHMANMFNYKLDEKNWPKAYLHCHVHGAKGITNLSKMLISNAATTVNVVEVP